MPLTDYLSLQGRVFQAYRHNFETGQFHQAANAVVQDASGPLGDATRRQRLQDRLATRTRTALDGYLDSLREASDVLLQYAMQEIGERFINRRQARRALVRYMAANDIYVDRRRKTYGANPADNIIGIHRRLTVNEWAHPIENGMTNEVEGILIEVQDTEVSGGSADSTRVLYHRNAGDDQNNLNSRGGDTSSGLITLVGPESGNTLNENPTLSGLAAPSDGDDIGADEIDNYDQDRTGIGSMTIKARPGTTWRSQPYGIGFGGTDGEVILTQPVQGWAMQATRPIAYMVPAFQAGAGVEADIEVDIGNLGDAWSEADTTNDEWTPLVSTLSEDNYPRNIEDGDTQLALKVSMDPGSSGEMVLGGIYVANMFQIGVGGEYHIAWERLGQAQKGVRARFGADSLTDEGAIQDLWCRIDEAGPSLPVSGSSKWSLPAAPSITTSSLPGADDGVTYSETLASTGGVAPVRWFLVDGALPGGMTLNRDTGVIAGTHAGTGTFPFVVEARDATGARAFKALSIEVT